MEILTAMTVFLVVVLQVGSLYTLAQRSYTRGIDQAELIQNARVCLDRLSRELRQTRNMITPLSASVPVNELYFQDGHDPEEITYIKYYPDGADLKRSHLAYYFPVDPDVYVYYDSVDAFGSPPEENILEDGIIGEYFDSVGFTGDLGLVDVSFGMARGQSDLSVDTKIYMRNW